MDEDRLRDAYDDVITRFPEPLTAASRETLSQLAQDDPTQDEITQFLYQECLDQINLGQQFLRSIVPTKGREAGDALVGAAATSLDLQLTILRVDVTALKQEEENPEAVSTYAFRAQADYLAVQDATLQFFDTLRQRAGDFRDSIDERVDAVTDWAGEKKDAAIDRLGQMKSAAGGVVGTIGSWLVDWLKRLGKNLWQLIQKLITPKDWSISGEAGVNILGFTGTVTLEVTFGQ